MSDSPTTVSNGVTLALIPGMVFVTGKLKTVMAKEKKVSLRTLCPGCLEVDGNTGVPVIQQLTCQHDHGPYPPGDCKDRGRQDGERIIPLTAAEVAETKGTDLDGLTMQLRIHPVAQVAHLNRPTGIVYAFDPGPAAAQLVGVLLDIIADGESAIVGEVTIKKGRRFMRLTAANHGLELVELARPEDVYDFEDRAYPYDAANLLLAMQLVEELTTDYDPAMYRDGSPLRLAAILAAKEDGPVSTITPINTPAPAANNLEAALAASLAALRAGKAAA